MIKQIVRLRGPIQQFINLEFEEDEEENENLFLTDELFDHMPSFATDLDLLHRCFLFFQNTQIGLRSAVLPKIDHIITTFHDVEDDRKYHSPSYIAIDLQARFFDPTSDRTDQMIIASCLDPRYCKTIKDICQRNELDHNYERALNFIRENLDEEEKLEQSPEQRTIDPYEQFLDAVSDIDERTDPLEWIRANKSKFKRLHSLFRQYLSVPAVRWILYSKI